MGRNLGTKKQNGNFNLGAGHGYKVGTTTRKNISNIHEHKKGPLGKKQPTAKQHGIRILDPKHHSVVILDENSEIIWGRWQQNMEASVSMNKVVRTIVQSLDMEGRVFDEGECSVLSKCPTAAISNLRACSTDGHNDVEDEEAMEGCSD